MNHDAFVTPANHIGADRRLLTNACPPLLLHLSKAFVRPVHIGTNPEHSRFLPQHGPRPGWSGTIILADAPEHYRNRGIQE